MTTIGMIFARGGSKGIPDKNIVDLAGSPLMTRAIDTAKAVGALDRIIVSTDSPRIAEIARTAGAEVPFLRPAALARDDAPEWLAWRHALEYLRDSDGGLPDLMVSIPTTAPLRLPSDIESVISRFVEGGWDAVVTATPARRSPYFNMVRIDESGRASIAIPAADGISRRQDAPQLYDLCTVAYAVRPTYVLDSGYLFAGRVGTIVIPPERALDIDTPFDLRVAELLLRSPWPH